MATVQQYATQQFNTYFLEPAKTTCEILIKGAQNSFTKNDITDAMWNTVVAACPFVASIGAAKVVNDFCHKHLVPETPYVKPVASLASRALALCIGGSVGLLIAGHLNVLAPIQADKALHLIALSVVSAAFTPLIYKTVPYLGVLAFPLFAADAGSMVGYFGHRSLYVIALMGALAGSTI